MLIELLEWFLDILENDGHDIREVKGKIHLALTLMKRCQYSFELNPIAYALMGKEEPNAE